MKKTIFKNNLLFLSLILIFNISEATFTDINPTSPLGEQLNRLEERSVLEGNGFFRSNEDLPLKMFWSILIRDTYQELPTTINPELGISPYDAYGSVAQKMEELSYSLSKTEYLNSISNTQALTLMLEIYQITPREGVSSEFLELAAKYEIPEAAEYLSLLESAYASKILTENNLKNFKPSENLSRREYIQWIDQYNQNGRLIENKIGSIVKVIKPVQFVPSEEIPVITVTPSEQHLNIPNGQILEAVLADIERGYYFEEELSEEKKEAMIEAAIEAMVLEMGDPYTNYYNPTKSSELEGNLQGEFEGIGASVEMQEGKFVILSPFRGSPAEKSGLKPKDIVIKVDGEEVQGLGTQEIIAKIKGPAGTTVTLTIQREGAEDAEYEITRGKIEIPATTLEWNDGIPVIGIHQFHTRTEPEVQALIEEVLMENPDGIIFDLRNNPGGYLNSAMDMGTIFVEEGALLFSVERRSGTQEFKASSTGILASYENPIIFLQNKGSASASEILALVLKDHEKGIIVGTSSFGKGTVQSIVGYGNGGSLKLTIAKWISPNGTWINKVGVTPDVEITEEEIEASGEEDIFIRKAIETINQNR